MPSCERCWEMSRLIASEMPVDQVDEYERLVRVNDCTPEQQAGRDAKTCPDCKTKTVHQHTRQCLVCGYDDTPSHRRVPENLGL